MNLIRLTLAIADSQQLDLWATIGRSQGALVRVIGSPDDLLAQLQDTRRDPIDGMVVEHSWTRRRGLEPGRLRGALDSSPSRKRAVVLADSTRIDCHPLLVQAAREAGADALLPALSAQRIDVTVMTACEVLAGAMGVVFRRQHLASFLKASVFRPRIDDALVDSHRALAELEARGLDLDGLQAAIDARVQAGDLTYLGKAYPEAFTGKDVTGALADALQVGRIEAVRYGQLLLAAGRMHHVVRDHPLRDEHLFYRWSRMTPALGALSPRDVAAALRGPRGPEVADRSYRGRTYPRCFVGSEAARWARSRYGLTTAESGALLQALFDLGEFRHVLDAHEFIDGHYFYVFAPRATEAG